MNKETSFKIHYKKVIRTKTNNGELCKQIFFIASSDKYEKALIIKKYILTRNLYPYLRTHHITVKTYKNFYLMRTGYSIKLNTLFEIFKWISKIYKPLKK